MNFSGYTGHATIFSRVLNIAYCLVVGIGFGSDLVVMNRSHNSCTYTHRVDSTTVLVISLSFSFVFIFSYLLNCIAKKE